MKYLLCAFLISLCITSSIASGKKYAQESISVVFVESGDVADCDDKSPPLYDTLEDFIFYLPSNFCMAGSSASIQFTCLSDSFYSFELDYFCPPPNFFFPVFTLG